MNNQMNIAICVDQNLKQFKSDFNRIGDRCYYDNIKPWLNVINENTATMILANTLLVDKATRTERDFISDKNLLKMYLFEEYEINGEWKLLLDKNNQNDIHKFNRILELLEV